MPTHYLSIPYGRVSWKGAQRPKDPVALGGLAPRLAARHGPRSVPYAAQPARGRGRPLPARVGVRACLSTLPVTLSAAKGLVALGGPPPRLAANHGPRSVPLLCPWGARPPRPGLAPASPRRDCSARDRTARSTMGPLGVPSSLRSSGPRYPIAARASGDPLAPQRWAAHPRGGLFSPTHPSAARPAPTQPGTSLNSIDSHRAIAALQPKWCGKAVEFASNLRRWASHV